MSTDSEEIERLTKEFLIFDTNEDGKITMDELEGVMRSMGQEPKKLELKTVMNDFDADKDGAITLEEFLDYMTKPGKPKYCYTDQELTAQFQIFDKDEDGYITEEEMASVVSELNLGTNFPQDVISQLFQEADTDQDGKINFQEFAIAML